MLGINTNLSSLIVQSNLSKSAVALNTAIERMTTGFKINSAKDNAAGFSISTKLSSQLSSYLVAQDNAVLGIDMLNTAMDNLSLMTGHISRIRDLTEQAANGTYGQTSLNVIQGEINAHLAECVRIVSNTEYNGISLLDNDDTSGFVENITPLSEEEAIAQGYTIIRTADELQSLNDSLTGKYILMNDIDLENYDWTPIGSEPGRSFRNGELNGNGYVIRNLTVDDTSVGGGLFAGTADMKILNLGLENVSINGGYYSGGLVGLAGNGTYIENCYANGDVAGSYMAGGLVGQTAISSRIHKSYANCSVSGEGPVGGLTGHVYNGSVTDSYALGSVYATYRLTGSAGGLIGRIQNPIEISNCYARAKVKSESTSVAAIVPSSTYHSFFNNLSYYSSVNENLSPFGDTFSGDLSLVTNITTMPGEVKFQVGINSSDSSQISLNFNLGYNLSVNVSSASAAKMSLGRIDEVLSIINSKQTEFGAAYNRLESSLESISVNIDNLTSSRSTLRDADIAKVSSEYIRNQILQEASATLLATANQSPALALQLI